MSSNYCVSAAPSNNLTTLDRTLKVVLDENNNDDTPSRRDGVPSETERLHTLHGTSLIWEATHELQLGPSALATACTLFHRFYKQVSLRDNDVWSVAMACTLLATKLEEEPKTMQDIIDKYANIYTRRMVMAELDEETVQRLVVSSEAAMSSSSSSPLSSLNYFNTVSSKARENGRWKTSKEKIFFCSSLLPTKLNKMGPVYQEWHKTLSNMEALLLRQLGFMLYWIPDAHPHKFILYFCQVLELKKDHHHPDFVQSAWNFCNDAARVDLCVRYRPEVIAASAILLASKTVQLELPMQPRPWWEVFLGDGKEQGQTLVDAANIIAGLVQMQKDALPSSLKNGSGDDDHKHAATRDWLIASRGVVRSLVTRTKDNETSFNDPNSFVWEHQKELFEMEIAKK
ncbi:MAG: hypothetical protein SGILL_009989 [Bacillariaceae sp.]